uniref:Uncharacterized protein n=1 Tax=Anguilla anguilla TaxID=7936 RepID=A0A0E9WVA7_ANGAN
MTTSVIQKLTKPKADSESDISHRHGQPANQVHSNASRLLTELLLNLSAQPHTKDLAHNRSVMLGFAYSIFFFLKKIVYKL